MRFGISHIIPLIFICLNFQLSYSQSSFRGKPCDDTEVRGYSGLPAWKNYGEWLSECDSLEDAWEDSIFAAISLEKKFREAEDEALALLYYRRSMKGLSKLDLQKALGKLMIKRQKMTDDSDTEKIDNYIYQLKVKLKNT